KPFPYDLRAIKLTTSKLATSPTGQPIVARGIYVYWFVADDELTPFHGERMWWMARDLLRSGVLQRWAYVTCFAVCQAGQEEITFNRLQQFIVASTPEFQITPRSTAALISADTERGGLKMAAHLAMPLK